MKKRINALLILLSAAILIACSGANGSLAQAQTQAQQPQAQTQVQPQVQPQQQPQPANANTLTTEQEPEADSGKILIAYYSRMGNMNFDPSVDAVTSASVQVDGSEFKGNNQVIAELLAEETGGDVFFIEQEDKYPAGYRSTTEQVQAEQNDGVKPALTSHVADMRQYDTVILVYPIWWGTLPPAIHTFLEEYDFSGKTVIPLCTHEGSQLGSSERDIAELIPNATMLKGLAIRGSDADGALGDLQAWLKELNLSN